MAAKAGPRRRRWLLVLLGAAAVLGAVRLALPSIVRSYVLGVLDEHPMYDGRIGDVDLHLWRGAYSIEDVRIVKTTGNVPVPFFAAERVDLAVEWSALLHGEAVGRVRMDRPELNFVDADDASQDQTGEGGPWLEMLRDLFPFKINSCAVSDGSIHFRAFQADPPVDVYLSRVEGSVENLTNIEEDVTPLVATVRAKALAMDEAQVDFDMQLDPFSYRPTFRMALRLLDLDVTKTNDLVREYGGVDFESGRFDLVVELDAKEGSLEGYVKPLFRDLEVLDLSEDWGEGNPLLLFWQALVGGVADVFKNPPRNQVATVIPVAGDVGATDTDFLATVGNLLRNAFVRAYLPRLQGGGADGVQFGPPSDPAFDEEVQAR